jgi:hypothetical protein
MGEAREEARKLGLTEDQARKLDETCFPHPSAE